MSDNVSQLRQAALGLERLAGLMRAQQWREPDAYALHPAQRALLELLGAQAGGWRVGALAQRLGVSAASVSDTISALEARELVRRERDPGDGRAVRIRATRRGAAWLRRSRARGGTGERLLAALPPDDLDGFARAVQLLIQQAQAQGLATGLRTCSGCEFFRPFGGAGEQPHFCELIGARFGDRELRVDCPEQRPRGGDVSAAAGDAVAMTFRDGPAPSRTHSATAE